MEKEEILLHCCCGPCSTASIERLLSEGLSPVLYYSNSNIYPKGEYDLRLENLEKVASIYGLKLFSDSYDHESWLSAVKGHEGDREGGWRCSLCFAFNLHRAAIRAKELGLHFCTTLTVSRFKNSKKIFDEGMKEDGFEQWDFKKRDGFSRSCVLAKEYGLYRQSYCGCEFSLRDSKACGEALRKTENVVKSKEHGGR